MPKKETKKGPAIPYAMIAVGSLIKLQYYYGEGQQGPDEATALQLDSICIGLPDAFADDDLFDQIGLLTLLTQ